jgi:hypothetical protein
MFSLYLHVWEVRGKKREGESLSTGEAFWLYRPAHGLQIRKHHESAGNDLGLSFTSPKHGTVYVPFLVFSLLINTTPSEHLSSKQS